MTRNIVSDLPIDIKASYVMAMNITFKPVCVTRLYVMLLLFVVMSFASADETALSSDFKMAQSLIATSSIAKHIFASQNVEAKSLQEQAREYFEKARKASEAGDKETAKDYLNKAKSTMFKAGQQLGNNKSSTEKAKQDYTHRYDNVASLLTALQRINKENGRSEDGDKIEKDIKDKMQEAQKLFDKGDEKKAKELIDIAFTRAKNSLIDLRDGKTLVRSLNFASKEEEYHYELDRNDTHKMLVKVLLKDKMKDPKTAARVKENIDKADALRIEAEQLAISKNFTEAVQTLENSTKQIVRAIRAAGIYIPG